MTKEPVEFILADNIQIYIVENGVDIEAPDLDSPFTGAVTGISLDFKDAIKLAEAILEYYK